MESKFHHTGWWDSAAIRGRMNRLVGQRIHMSTLERAIEIAARAHVGQVDKGGQPYILHPIRLMLKVKTVSEQMAAVLHDVVEDTSVTFEVLAAEGFPDE